MTMLKWSLTLALSLACFSPAAKNLLAADAAAAGDNLILDNNSYFRQHTEFGLIRLNGEVLKKEGEKLFGKGLGHLEQLTKKLLAGKNYDWTKTDWRDVASYYAFLGQAGDDAELFALMPSVPAPADWTKADFDDSGFDRVRIGDLPQNFGGDEFFDGRALYRRGLYIRTYFEVPDPAAAGDLTVRVVHRGGARVFVNGREIGRNELPAGPITPETFGTDYPQEAYVAKPEELPPKPGFADFIGDIRCSFDEAVLGDANFKTTYGNTPINRAGWERIQKLRDRVLGPVKIPANLLRKSSNTLAIEIRVARYHPIFIPGARGMERNWVGNMGVNLRWDHARLVDVALRSTANTMPSCLTRPKGLQAWADDVHKWLFEPDYNPAGFPQGAVRFVGGPNGTYSALIGTGTDAALTRVKTTVSDLSGPGGAVIPTANLAVSYMAGHGLDEIGQLGSARCDPGECRGMTMVGNAALWRYPEVRRKYTELAKDRAAQEKFVHDFKFFDHVSVQVPETVPANTCQPVLLTLRVPENAPAGIYKGTVKIEAADARPVTLPVEAEVIGWRVPGPQEFQTFVQSEQTPYGILKAYKIEAWSDRHWQLIESSFRQLARIGNGWVYVPVLMNSELGNREDQMIKWIRKKNGALAFDFSLMEKYLALATKTQGRPKAVCFLVMHGVASPSNSVKVFDEVSGKTDVVEIGPGQGATRKPYWRAFAVALRERMKALGLEDAMYYGQGFDDVPDKDLIGLLAEVTPGVHWTSAGHYRAPDETCWVAARAYGMPLLPRSQMGWKHPFIQLLMGRTGGSVICTEGISPPINWRVGCDRAIYAGCRGIGRVGADYFQQTWFDGFRGGVWNMAGRGSVMTLWPGPNAVESSLRHEAILEGVQEAEIRIFLEEAIDRKVLPEELALEAQTVLDDHVRSTMYIASGVRDNGTMEMAQHWQERSRRLYQAAAKVAQKIGIDVDRTQIGGSSLTIMGEDRKPLRVDKIAVPSLGETKIPLKIRNWSQKPRAWKASTAEPWIVPEKTEGVVAGHQALMVVLDGKTLQPGQELTGTLTVTDKETGAAYPVKITATVVKAIEYQVRQSIKFVTGGGSGTEMPKTLFIESEPVLNVPVGGSGEREYFLVSRAKEKQPWKIESNAPWLTTEPASGEIAPGAMLGVKIVARPADKEGAAYENTLTLTAAGGAVKEEYKVRTFVMPSYRVGAAAPAGDVVWLNDVDHKVRMKSHMDGGGTASNPNKHISRDYPWPWYQRFNRVEHGDLSPKDRSLWNTTPFNIGDKTYTHGLWVSPTHETVFNIEGAGFTAFAAETGYFQTKDGRTRAFINFGAIVNFEIYVDGKLRAQSNFIKSDDPARLLVVDNLQNAKEIKLVTHRDDLINDTYCTVVWADPRFIKSATAQTPKEVRK